MEEKKIRWRQQGKMSLRRPGLYFAIIPVAGIFPPAFARGRALLANKFPLVGDRYLIRINSIFSLILD